MGTKTALKTESFALFENFHFMTTEYYIFAKLASLHYFAHSSAQLFVLRSITSEYLPKIRTLTY